MNHDRVITILNDDYVSRPSAQISAFRGCGLVTEGIAIHLLDGVSDPHHSRLLMLRHVSHSARQIFTTIDERITQEYNFVFLLGETRWIAMSRPAVHTMTRM